MCDKRLRGDERAREYDLVHNTMLKECPHHLEVLYQG